MSSTNRKYNKTDTIVNMYCSANLTNKLRNYKLTIFGDGKVVGQKALSKNVKKSITKDVIETIIAKAEAIELPTELIPKKPNRIHDGKSCYISVLGLGLSGDSYSFGSGPKPQKEIIELKNYILSIVSE